MGNNGFFFFNYRSFASAVAATLDTNKYKFLTKMPLSELEIAKGKNIFD